MPIPARNLYSPGNYGDMSEPMLTTGMRAYAQPHAGPFGSQIFKAKGHMHNSVVLDKSLEQGAPPLSALSNNIMKVNSDDLSYSQVKSVRGQISRDCSLLKNRVRLLQTEMERTNKKIAETSRKTEQLKKARE